MLDPITAALIAGAAAGVAQTATQAIQDAYTALKTLIQSKFAKTASAITVMEEDPKDTDAQAVLGKRLADAKVAEDAAIRAAAEKLVAALGAADIATPKITHTATGDGNVQIAGDNNHVTSNVSRNNSGISVQGSTVNGDIVHGDKVGGDKIGNQINTGGGAYFAKDVHTAGDFVGRDKVVHNYSTAPELSAIDNAEARALVPLLYTAFSLSDIEALCFEMGIDDEQLRGQIKDEKARSLVKYVDDHGQLADLRRLMRVARPNLRDQLK